MSNSAPQRGLSCACELPSCEHCATLLAGLRERGPELAKLVHAQICAIVPCSQADADLEYHEDSLAAVEALLQMSLAASGSELSQLAPAPHVVLVQTRRAVGLGVGLGTLLRRCAALHDRFMELVEEQAEHACCPDRGAVLGHLRRRHAALIASLALQVEEEYRRESENLARSPDRDRFQVVQRLLAGESDALAGLSYDLDTWHLGMIAIGPACTRLLRAAEAATGRPLLLVKCDEKTVWAWLGARNKPPAGTLAALASVAVDHEASLAVGEPARMLEGFRLTHWQAQEALQFTRVAGQAFTRYADVALVTPWLRKPTAARALVECYLWPLLNEQHRRGAVLRETLRAYFAEGRNATAAAGALCISRRTMCKRMERIEEALGARLHTHQPELELALRLDRLIVGERSAQNVNGGSVTVHRLALAAPSGDGSFILTC